MNYVTAFCWDGKTRGSGTQEKNEDSLLIEQIRTDRERILLAAVSDGIGGLAEGENASGFCAEELKRWFYGEAQRILTEPGMRRKRFRMLEKSLHRQLYHAMQQLTEYGQKNRKHLGATLSAVLLIGRRMLLCSIGDSRILLFSGNKQRLLTRDDTDEHGRLLRCIGTEGWYPLQFTRMRLRKQDILLLCTDGFWKRLRREDVSEVSADEKQKKESDWGNWLENMCITLRKRGETDDITAIWIQLTGGEHAAGSI